MRARRVNRERTFVADSGHKKLMKNGTPYKIHPCVEPDLQCTPQHLREQIREALKCMSTQSRWQRFASPVHELSEKQLDYLTNLDGRDRVAWCALTIQDDKYRGIGLSRYIRLPDEAEVAEFAVTVVDEFQGQGIGRALLEGLIESAQENGIKVLRGYVLTGNKKMLELCKRLQATDSLEDTFVRVDIPVTQRPDKEAGSI